MIWPERTSSPEKIFTPRYCGFESRPFFDEPRPFLCAIGRLLPERRLERRERALAPGVLALVGERCLALGGAPFLGRGGDLGDRHLRIPRRQPLGARRLRRLGGLRLLRRRLGC